MVAKFFKEEEGAQIIEYALIIAVISIALVLALEPLTLAGGIAGMVTKVGNCLSGVGCA